MLERKISFLLRITNKGTYLLLILLCVFGVFYFVGTQLKLDASASSWLSTYTDLWANLFASMIVIIGVERIVSYMHFEKNKPSVSYVKERVTQSLIDLMISMRIPDNWRDKMRENGSWTDFLTEFLNSKDKTLQELERIIDNYSFILEPELRNDLFSIVHIMREYRLYPESPQEKLWNDLIDSANLSLVLVSRTKEIMQRHKLASHVGTEINFKSGEMPKVNWGKLEVFNSHSKHVSYDEWIKDTIAFRDECYKNCE